MHAYYWHLLQGSTGYVCFPSYPVNNTNRIQELLAQFIAPLYFEVLKSEGSFQSGHDLGEQIFCN